MKKLLYAIGLLLALPNVVSAQTLGYQGFAADVNGTSLPAGPIGTLDRFPFVQGATSYYLPGPYIVNGPTVPNLTALQNACTSNVSCSSGNYIYVNGVWRVTDGALGAPPLFFAPLTGTCSSNSLIADGASCVNSANGNAWKGKFAAGGADIREWSCTTILGCSNALTWATTTGNLLLPIPSATTPKCAALVNYGGVADGTTDNTAALTATVAASPGLGKCIILPPGTVHFATTNNITIPASGSVAIYGAGPDVTNISAPPGVNALAIIFDGVTNQSATTDGMTFLATGNAITNPASGLSYYETGNAFIAATQSRVSNVTFRGDQGYPNLGSVTHCWTNGFFTDNVSNISFINDNFSGCTLGSTLPANNGSVGINLGGNSTPGAYGIIYNISDCNFAFLQWSVNYGENLQGVTISQSNFTPDDEGIHANNSLVGIDGLTVVGSQFGYDNYGINAGTGIPLLIFNDNLFGGPVNHGIYMQSQAYGTITGNMFQGFNTFIPPYNTLVGIQIDTNQGSYPFVISGNTITGWTTAGIQLGATTGAIRVADNAWASATELNGTNVLSSSPSNIITGSVVGYTDISAIADNGSGITRVTVTSTAAFTNGSIVMVPGSIANAVGELNTPIAVIDGTHMDLTEIVFNAAGTAGGKVSWIP